MTGRKFGDNSNNNRLSGPVCMAIGLVVTFVMIALVGMQLVDLFGSINFTTTP